MNWIISTPATTTVLTWQQILANAKPSLTEEVFVMDLVREATAYVEQRGQLVLLPQTITATYTAQDVPLAPWVPIWRPQRIELPRGPVLGITSVLDASGNPIPYTRQADGNRELIVPTSQLVLSSFPITVVYTAGFNPIPADLVGIVRKLTTGFYVQREPFSASAANDVYKIDDYLSFRGRGSLVY